MSDSGTRPLKVLGLDGALQGFSVAVVAGDACLARRADPGPRGQAEAMLPMIQACLAEAGLSFPELDAIAVTVGPGGFTGLRVALATARGLRLAMGKPAVGISTLEAIAAGIPADTRAGRSILSVIDARRGEVFAQAFAADLKPLSEPIVASPGEAARLVTGPVVLAGTGEALVRPHLPAALGAVAPPEPDAATIARLVASRPAPPPDLPAPQPIYLRAPDARPAA